MGVEAMEPGDGVDQGRAEHQHLCLQCLPISSQALNNIIPAIPHFIIISLEEHNLHFVVKLGEDELVVTVRGILYSFCLQCGFHMSLDSR